MPEEEAASEPWCVALRHVSGLACFSLTCGALVTLAVNGIEMLRYETGFVSADLKLLYDKDNFVPERIQLPNATDLGLLKSALGGLPLWYAGFAIYFPVSFYYYLGKDHFPVKTMLFAVLLERAALVVLYGYFEIELFHMLNPLLACGTCWAVLKLKLPKDSKIPKLVLAFIAVIFFGGFIPINMLHMLPYDNDFFEFGLYAFIYPAMREVERFVCTRTGWYLMADADVLGSKDSAPLHRTNAWVFVVWIQLFWAIFFRVQVANLQNTTLAVIIYVWQAVTEIFLRVTVQERDAAIRKLLERFSDCRGNTKEKIAASFKKRDPSAKIAPAPSQRESATRKNTILAFDEAISREWTMKLRSMDSRAAAKASFYAIVVNMDMCSEYAAIVISTMTIYFWRTKPLVYPFNFYASQELGGLIDTTTVVQACVFQLIIEFFVDLICVKFEKREMATIVWKKAHKRSTLLLFCLACFFSYCCAAGFFLTVDHFSNCYGHDLCDCDGLSQKGYRQLYCMKALLASNQSGSP